MRDIVLIITYVFLEIILISPHPARYTRHLLQGEGFKAEKGNIFIEILERAFVCVMWTGGGFFVTNITNVTVRLHFGLNY